MNNQPLNQKQLLFGVFIWVIAASFFLYEFFLRTFVGSIADEIIRTLHLSAEELSIIGGAYFITYGIMQIPVGILIDTFGVKKLLSFAALICSLGVLVFSIAHQMTTAFIGRLLMGFGSSFGFVCLLSLSLNWFPRKHFGLLVGLAQLLGAIGPILAGAPLVLILYKFHDNWRIVSTGIAAIGILITILIVLFVQNKPAIPSYKIRYLEIKTPIRINLLSLIKNFQAWWIVLYSSAVNTSLALLGIVWGTPFLESKGLSQPQAALITSFIWIGFALGCPLLGFISDRTKRRKIVLIICALIGALSTLYLIVYTGNNSIILGMIFILLGVSATGQSVAFAIISEHVKTKVHATAFGLNNAFIMLSSAFFIPFFGLLIQRSATHLKTTAQMFHPQNFQSSLMSVLIINLIALLIATFYIKETYCRQQNEPYQLQSS